MKKIISAFCGCTMLLLYTIQVFSAESLCPDRFMETDSGFRSNYIIVETVRIPGVRTDADLNMLTTDEKITQVTYSDGFGRASQTVDVQASSDRKNIITPYVYDARGRQSTSFLPFVNDSNAISYHHGALAAQADFYAVGGQIAADTQPYSTILYDDSPLNRVVEVGAVGSDWQPGTGHTVKTAYKANTVSDNVLKWTIAGPSGFYDPNTLFLTETVDENGNMNKVYADKMGRTLLRRSKLDEQITEHGNSEFVEWLEIYYVYNDVGNLVYIVPPKASAKIKNGANWDSSFIEEWVYTYTYNDDGRVVKGKVPGSGATYVVYDQLGRVVLTQDAKNRSAGKWFFIKYDLGGRPVYQGTYTFAELYPAQGLTPHEQLQKYYRELDYDSPGVYYHEEADLAGIHGYTNRVFPTSGIEPLTVAYYDGYDFDHDGTPDYNYQSVGLSGEESTAFKYLQGQLTGTKTKVLGSSTWLTVALFYDKHGRVIQKRSNNHVHNTATLDDIQTAVYEGFSVLPRAVKQVTNGALGQSTIVVSQLEYDHRDRLLALHQSDNGSPARKVASYEYNKIGQLINKNIHREADTTVIQSLSYRYNIRGWLTHINNSSLAMESDGVADLFGMELMYNSSVSGLNNTARFDGRISAVKWKTNDEFSVSTDPVYERSYRFQYDKAGRLKDALYAADDDGSWSLQAGAYDEKNIRYDHNGNILALQRYQLLSGSTVPVLMDDLTYTYAGGKGNQLTSVSDASINPGGFKSVNYSGDEGYLYDENGNLVTDKNKGDGTTAMNITYNEIGKTSRVDLPGGRYVQYTYAASGVRLRKEVYTSTGLTKKVDYIEGYVYEDESLAYYQMAEGRVRNTGTGLRYEYYIRDHQGNVRVSFEESAGVARIVQENHYYPFGLGMKGAIIRTAMPTSPNKNLYNSGSELQDDFGDDPYLYSTFFREYDPVLGRMNAIDPMASTYHWISPYNYAFNDPFNLNDPTGADPFNDWEEVEGWIGEMFESKYGGHWEDGETYLFESYADAFYTLSFHLDTYDGWGYTDAGSYASASDNFFEMTGIDPGDMPGSITMTRWYRDGDGQPMEANGLSGASYLLHLNRNDVAMGRKVGNDGWNTAGVARKAEILDEMSGSMIPFDIIATSAETLRYDTRFVRLIGLGATVIGTGSSFYANKIRYDSGLIDKDRYQFRNIGNVTSTGVGLFLGRYHPALGFVGGTATSSLFDGIETAADYLNNGVHQIKSQIIHSIKIQY